MLRDIDSMLLGFQNVCSKTRQECNRELDSIHQLILDVNIGFFKIYFSFLEKDPKNEQKGVSSLVEKCYIESVRTASNVLFFACNGLYRNAFDDIRHVLESAVQALYIDLRHPKSTVGVKIEILKEVEDKVEYHSVRLIDELPIDFKDRLKSEYKKLSRIIHPSHQQAVTAIKTVIEQRNPPSTVDCREVANIYESLRIMYDILIFLYIKYFSELEKPMKEDPNFVKVIEKFGFSLLAKSLKIKL